MNECTDALFKIIQASTSTCHSTIPVIQLIYSNDIVFPSLCYQKKKGVKENHMILTRELDYAEGTDSPGQI